MITYKKVMYNSKTYKILVKRPCKDKPTTYDLIVADHFFNLTEKDINYAVDRYAIDVKAGTKVIVLSIGNAYARFNNYVPKKNVLRPVFYSGTTSNTARLIFMSIDGDTSIANVERKVDFVRKHFKDKLKDATLNSLRVIFLTFKQKTKLLPVRIQLSSDEWFVGYVKCNVLKRKYYRFPLTRYIADVNTHEELTAYSI